MKVLIGCPTSEIKSYCLEKYIKRIKELDYDNYDILLVDNSENNDYYNLIKSYDINVIKVNREGNIRQILANSRNILRVYALKNGYDYFFSLEQDIIPPKDIIKRLLRHKVRVVCGLYTKDYKLKDSDKIYHLPILYIFDNGKPTKCTLKYICQYKFLQIAGSGLGCTMIHKSVLERIEFRCEEGKMGYDDVFFSHDLFTKLKIKYWCDTTAFCLHLEKEWNFNPGWNNDIYK